MNNDSWLNQVQEEALEPNLLICDPHHHLWDRSDHRYVNEDLLQDTGLGHTITHTVFIECMSMYRESGPKELKPVGETEYVEKLANQNSDVNTKIAAGIADYEAHPEEHPNIIVARLKEMGENEIAHALAGHYTKWNVPRNSMLDKCIIAADEITGFIVAAALIRPTKIEGIKVKSVMKKFKTATFAAKVDREECLKGAEMIGLELRELIDFIIPVLQANKEELGLAEDS